MFGFVGKIDLTEYLMTNENRNRTLTVKQRFPRQNDLKADTGNHLILQFRIRNKIG